MKLAVLDWGIGGFGLVRELLVREPAMPLVYFSDAGTTPYGLLSRAALRARLGVVARFLRDLGTTDLAIACNAASSVLGEERLAPDLALSDVVSYGVDLVLASGAREVGLVGGRRTIRSGAHRRAIEARDGRVSLASRVAQPLSAFVERGDLTSDAVQDAVSRVVAPLRHVSVLLLACTHYPAIAPLFREALPKVALLDPAPAMAMALVSRKRPRRELADAANVVALTTGDPRALERAALRAFQVAITGARRVPPGLAASALRAPERRA